MQFIIVLYACGENEWIVMCLHFKLKVFGPLSGHFSPFIWEKYGHLYSLGTEWISLTLLLGTNMIIKSCDFRQKTVYLVPVTRHWAAMWSLWAPSVELKIFFVAFLLKIGSRPGSYNQLIYIMRNLICIMIFITQMRTPLKSKVHQLAKVGRDLTTNTHFGQAVVVTSIIGKGCWPLSSWAFCQELKYYIEMNH